MEQTQAQEPIQPAQKKSKNVIKSLLLALTVLLVIGAGYAIYSMRQHVDRLESVIAAKDEEIIKLQKSATPAEESTSSKFLDIPELGVRIELSEDIYDAYYQVNAENSVGLKTHSLDNEKMCRESSLSIVGLFRVDEDDTDEITGEKLSESRVGVNIDDKFYYAQGAQYACAQDEANFDHLNKVRVAFIEAAKSLEEM